MLNINRIMITGRMTRNPESRNLATGTVVATFGVAVNRRYQAGNGEWKEETFFMDVEVWGKMAERIASDTSRYYKGRPVYVEGRLKIDEWERDGVKRNAVRINADVVTPFDVPRTGDNNSSAEPAAAPYAAPQQTNPYQQKQQSSAALPTPGASRPSDGLNWSNAPTAKPAPTEDDMPF